MIELFNLIFVESPTGLSIILAVALTLLLYEIVRNI
jgi:hypothetical protein